jgi:tRNA-splicing ligase RtcB
MTLAEHAGSIKVLHTLRPFAVAMAGAGEFDPSRTEIQISK